MMLRLQLEIPVVSERVFAAGESVGEQGCMVAILVLVRPFDGTDGLANIHHRRGEDGGKQDKVQRTAGNPR